MNSTTAYKHQNHHHHSIQGHQASLISPPSSMAPTSLVIREKKLAKMPTDEHQHSINNHTPLIVKTTGTYQQHQQHHPTINYKGEWSPVSSHYCNGYRPTTTTTRSSYSSSSGPPPNDDRAMQNASRIAGQNDDLDGGGGNDDKRTRNYQELSESINDLFSNLLRHLEKQKNKDYLINCDSTSLDFNTSNNTKTPKVSGLLIFSLNCDLCEFFI